MKSLYFSHDANARFDPKIILLISKYGYEGYGLFWAILEYMFIQEGYIEDYNTVITAILPCYNKDITPIITEMITLELFKIDEKNRLYNSRIIDFLNNYKTDKTKKSIAGKKGMESRWNNTVITPLKQRYNTDITNKNKNKNKNKITKESVKENEPHTHKFQIFIKEKCENISRLKKQLTEKECITLEQNYSTEQLMEIWAAMENKASLVKDYSSVYLTTINWIKLREKQNAFRK